MAKIILNMGHRDLTGGGTAGGGLTEYNMTPVLVHAIRDTLKFAGHVVYVNQELDPWDLSPDMLGKNLDYVGRNAVDIAKGMGSIDAYLSIHLEGASQRGLFAIVPDSEGLLSFTTGQPDPGDWWANNPKDVEFAHALADHCTQSTGLQKRSTTEPGVMSERATGVGLDGWRLSEFHETVPIRMFTTRNILECGAMPTADIDIIKQSGFPKAIATGVLAAVNEVFGMVIPAPLDSKYFSDDHTIQGPYIFHCFGDGYDPQGPVSKLWRSWTKNHDSFPSRSWTIRLDDRYTEYSFGNGVLRIIFDNVKNVAFYAEE